MEAKMTLVHSLLLFIVFNGHGTVTEHDTTNSSDRIVCTILYDNTSAADSIIADHGFSCLIESGDHSLLFDAGRISNSFLANAGRLLVDCSRMNRVFVSHFHDDHMGGLFDILAKCNKPTLYLPFSYPQMRGEPLGDEAEADFKALLARFEPLVYEIIRKKEAVEIDDMFSTTGMIEDHTYEHALIVSTPNGLVVVTGCAHPGILDVVERAKALKDRDVYFVLGGFHLVRTDSARVRAIAEELRTLTKYVGPCHCTGKEAREIIRDVFKGDYVDIRAGVTLTLSDGNL